MLSFLQSISTPYSIGISALISIAIGASVLFNNFKAKINRVYFLICFLTGWWFFILALTLFFIGRDDNLAFSLFKLGYLLVPFIAASFYHFYYAQFKKGGIVLYILYALALLESTYWFFFIDVQTGAYLVPHVGPVYAGMPATAWLFLFGMIKYMIVTAMTTVMFFLESKKETNSINRKRLQLFSLFNFFFLWASIEWVVGFNIPLHIGWLALPPFVGIAAYSIIRYRAFDVETVIHKAILWLFTSIIAFAPVYFLLIFFRKATLLKMSDAQVWLVSVGGLIIFNLYQKYVQAGMNYFFRQKKYDYRTRLKNLPFEIGLGSDIDSFAKKLLEALSKTLFVKSSFLALKIADDGNYAKIADLGYGDETKYIVGQDMLASASPLAQWFARHKSSSLSWDILETDPYFHDAGNGAKEFFRQNSLAIMIPLMGGNQAIGFIGLGEKDNVEGWSNDDKDLLVDIGRQTGVIFQNFIYQKELHKEQEEAQKKLEKLVNDRTGELKSKNEELERLNKLMAGREYKMIELKQRIEELEKKSGVIS